MSRKGATNHVSSGFFFHVGKFVGCGHFLTSNHFVTPPTHPYRATGISMMGKIWNQMIWSGGGEGKKRFSVYLLHLPIRTEPPPTGRFGLTETDERFVHVLTTDRKIGPPSGGFRFSHRWRGRKSISFICIPGLVRPPSSSSSSVGNPTECKVELGETNGPSCVIHWGLQGAINIYYR